MINKKTILIGLGAITLIGLILWATLDTTPQKTTGSEDLVTDRDTGETISIAPDTGVSAGAAGEDFNQLPTFGLIQLNEALEDNSGPYTDYISIGINSFIKQRLSNKYSTLTIIPESTRLRYDEIYLSLRLGQTDDIVPITITPSLNKDSMILRVNDRQKKYGGDFVYIPGLTNQELLYTISYTQTYEKESDPIKIQVDASMSYREAAIDQIRTLGFDPGDFDITFNDYENPFK